MAEFKLPDVGEGLTEAEIVTWKVSVGDVIKVNDVIVDIETAKSIVELPSPYEGTIEALLVSEGTTVDVGTPIIRITSADEVIEATAAEASITATSEDLVPAVGEERHAVLVGYGPRAASTKRRARKGAAAAVHAGPVAPPAAEPAAPPAAEPAARTTQTLRALAKPPVRKLAKDLGIDLAEVPCEGEIITRADVEAFASRGSGPAIARRDQTATERRIPIKGVRKMTAAAMVSSAFTAPHVTEWITLDVSRTMELVSQLKRDPAFADVKVSPLLIVAKAVCLAMRRTPELNSTWDEAAQEIVLKGSINLGIAAATPRGLVVPNIVGAESMSMRELADAFR